MIRSEVVAIIPARGGSKGVVDKNLRFVGDRSLISRSISTAQTCPNIDRVIVSTDSDAISAEASRYGAEIVVRPQDLSGDRVSSEAVLLHALQSAPKCEVLVFLQCTSPFFQGEDLLRVLAPVLSGQADVAFSAVPFRGFLWKRDSRLGSTGINHDPKVRYRRQDRPTELLETGAAYVMRTDGFRKNKHRFFGRIEPVELSPHRALEIDDPLDLELARGLAHLLDNQIPLPRLRVPRAVALDFDGVFTNNQVWVDQDGREAVVCNRADGHGISQLRERLEVVVFSTEQNPVVAARCEKLHLRYQTGLGGEKEKALRQWARREGIPLSEVLFVGSDVNDLGCLRAVGTAVAVADADPEVRAAAHVVLSRKGGEGALRELSDALLLSMDGR